MDITGMLQKQGKKIRKKIPEEVSGTSMFFLQFRQPFHLNGTRKYCCIQKNCASVMYVIQLSTTVFLEYTDRDGQKDLLETSLAHTGKMVMQWLNMIMIKLKLALCSCSL
jgi:hypothetical protein